MATPDKRVRAGLNVLLGVGLAVMSVGLRSASADGPAPIAPAVAGVASLPGTAAAPTGATPSASVSPAGVNVGGSANTAVAAPSISVPAPVQSAVSISPTGSSTTTVSASVGGGSAVGVSASLGTTSSGQPAVSASIAAGAVGSTAAAVSVSANSIGPAVPTGSTAQLSGNDRSGAESLPVVADPLAGLTPGGAASADPPGHGPAGDATEPPGPVRATSQDAPVICSQLVFRPLVAGCQALLGPIGGAGLAPTGVPLLTGLVGVLLILVGGMTSWRSGHRGGAGKGAFDASRERRTAHTDA